MKKNAITIFLLIVLVNTSYANIWVTIPSTKDIILLDDNFKPVKNQWYKYDNDNDGYYEFFYLNEKGIMLKNTTTIDGKYVNAYGLCEEDGKIKKEKIQTTSTIISNSNNNILLETNNNINAVSETSNIIMSSEITSSTETKRALKTNITNKSGIEFVDSKRINGKSWVNLIRLSGYDSYLKAKAENFNELSFEVGIDEISNNCSYLLTIFVNGEQLAEYDEEYFNTDENIVVNFDPNTEITITYSATVEEGQYLSTNNRYLYLRNASFRYNKNK